MMTTEVKMRIVEVEFVVPQFSTEVNVLEKETYATDMPPTVGCSLRAAWLSAIGCVSIYLSYLLCSVRFRVITHHMYDFY